MNLLIDTKYRTDKIELMDDFSINGELLYDTLDKLASINKWLGGNQVTLSGLKLLLKGQSKKKYYTILDLGCGSGDILRSVARFGKKQGYQFTLIGIDANKDTVNYASLLSKAYENITYKHCDIFSEEFNELHYDIVLSTLFLHHFDEGKLEHLLSTILSKASLGMVVNDLHRNRLAYYLFKIVCLVIPNKMVKEDGLTSVLRGFKQYELEAISMKLGASSRIRWKWAFRYQWIIQQNK